MLPLGFGYAMLSALGFSLMAVCVKYVGNEAIPVFEIVAVRGAVSLFISYLDIKRKKISVWGNNKLLLITRGLVGSLALICVYYSVTHLPLAQSTVLQYLYPVFTAILALFFLKEKVQVNTFICIVFSLIGLLIMLHPDFIFSSSEIDIPVKAILIALLGAFGSACAYVIVRRLSHSEDSSVIIFYFPLIALPLSLLLLKDNFIIPNLKVGIVLILVGIFTQIGQIGLTNAMRYESAAKTASYAYIQIVFSIIWGYLFFNEIPLLTTIVGMLCILSGAWINLRYKKEISR